MPTLIREQESGSGSAKNLHLGAGGMAQTIYAHVSKYKNDKIKK
jgi:shikimate 5-dehydrogenase